MWHAQTGLGFVYFYYSVNLLLYFSNVLYLHLLDLWDVSMWTGILGLYFVWQNAGKSISFTGWHEHKLFV